MPEQGKQEVEEEDLVLEGKLAGEIREDRCWQITNETPASQQERMIRAQVMDASITRRDFGTCGHTIQVTLKNKETD